MKLHVDECVNNGIGWVDRRDVSPSPPLPSPPRSQRISYEGDSQKISLGLACKKKNNTKTHYTGTSSV